MAHKEQDLGKEVARLQNAVKELRDAVASLETEKDNLRQAVRKLKAENLRTKDKFKKFLSLIKIQAGETVNDEGEFPEYDEIGKDFILVGGTRDPLAIRYEVVIKDNNGTEHKSVERYYWAQMADHFKDAESRKKIIEAPSTLKAEEVMREIKDFDEKVWDEVKFNVWKEGQRLKFQQHRWIANILIETGDSYIAVSHQDKHIGTGWRKNREESRKPLFWDGQNLGGKFLMNLRKDLAANHSWKAGELEEAKQKCIDLKRFVWRRVENPMGFSGGFRGGRFSRGSRQFPSNRGRYDKRPNGRY